MNLQIRILGLVLCYFAALHLKDLNNSDSTLRAKAKLEEHQRCELQVSGVRSAEKWSSICVVVCYPKHSCTLDDRYTTSDNFTGLLLIDGFIGSGYSTILQYCFGTTVRIPFEVLKQRLQAGIFNNIGGRNILYRS